MKIQFTSFELMAFMYVTLLDKMIQDVMVNVVLFVMKLNMSDALSPCSGSLSSGSLCPQAP